MANKATTSPDFGGIYLPANLPAPSGPGDAARKAYVDAATSVDMQSVTVASQTTSSATFVNIPGLTLSTKDFGANAVYFVRFCGQFTTSSLLALPNCQFRFVVGATNDTALPFVLPALTAQSNAIVWEGKFTSVNGIIIIKGQFLTNNTITLTAGRLSIHGMPQSNLL